MKKYLFIALAVLVAACEKPILDEDVVSMNEANVILHMTQYDQEMFGNNGNRAATRAATGITELCSRLNIAIFDDEGTKVKTEVNPESWTQLKGSNETQLQSRRKVMRNWICIPRRVCSFSLS